MLGSCAGKDLHKLSLPVYVNEPLTDLQRRAEAFEASELLDQVLLSKDFPEQHKKSALAECIHCLSCEREPSGSLCCSLAAVITARALLPLGNHLHCARHILYQVQICCKTCKALEYQLPHGYANHSLTCAGGSSAL